MAKKSVSRKTKYLYAIVNGAGSRRYRSIGIGGNDVYTIRHGDFSAVVSDVPGKKLRPERRNLAAHQEVLKTLMNKQTPLPVAFGIVAASEGDIRKILGRNQKGLTRAVTSTVPLHRPHSRSAGSTDWP